MKNTILGWILASVGAVVFGGGIGLSCIETLPGILIITGVILAIGGYNILND